MARKSSNKPAPKGTVAKVIYQRALYELLKLAFQHDDFIIAQTKKLIGRMREEVIAKTAEMSARVRNNTEPDWGPYWVEPMIHAHNEVVDRLGTQFGQDLGEWCIQAHEIGQGISDKGLEFAVPGISIDLPRLDPELVKIASGFNADLITRMKKDQIKALSKEITLSVVSPQSSVNLLIDKLTDKLDGNVGPWKSINYRAEIIARTETARVQELGRIQRAKQQERAFPDVKILYQFLCAPILKWPCKECDSYDGNVYDTEGNLVIQAKWKKGGPRPDLPIHPGCRCSCVPFAPGYSQEPEREEPADHGKEVVLAEWDTKYEGWKIKFHHHDDQQPHQNVQMIRLPVNVDEETLRSEIGKLALANGAGKAEDLDIRIDWPREKNKPADRSGPVAIDKALGTAQAKDLRNQISPN